MAKQNPSTQPRTGQPDPKLDRVSFDARFHARFYDPAFDPLRNEIDKLAQVAWEDGEASTLPA